jgi:uncharacterized protein (DUF1684 family)
MKKCKSIKGWPETRITNSLVTLVILLQIIGCSGSDTTTSPEYISEIEHWQQLRVDSLKGHTGFLNLAGLFWINNEVSNIGADSTNSFVFPAKAAKILGQIILKKDSVWFVQHEPGLVKVEGNANTDTTLIFLEGSISLSMSSGDLHWFIIKRGKEYGVRLKDYDHPLLATFNHIDTYPIDAKWRVEATWEDYADHKTVTVHNQVGMEIEQQVLGALHFKLEGNPYKLEPLGAVYEGEHFVLIYDKTSGHETYGSGRYIYVPAVNEEGITYIDFNKAYNPPCVYTEFATCLFPHEANRLPISIEAGEKYSGTH